MNFITSDFLIITRGKESEIWIINVGDIEVTKDVKVTKDAF